MAIDLLGPSARDAHCTFPPGYSTIRTPLPHPVEVYDPKTIASTAAEAATGQGHAVHTPVRLMYTKSKDDYKVLIDKLFLDPFVPARPGPIDSVPVFTRHKAAAASSTEG
ncbi:hypothetical protein MKZ38_005478 [Zalerion maritima]|uniref:Uncharacterized protein n=1 Tax=Zalerion maritima TaxID=339359 RepID=A0AAD5WQ87_9PEZI|nr:hypothetical protein MKZ38_005478 [Zalerion maritima]